MTIASLKILCRLSFPEDTVRLWDGSGPYLDPSGDIWQGMVLREGLDVVETAMNGEAYSLALGVSGVGVAEIVDMAYEEVDEGDVIGSQIELLIQTCDESDAPVGAPEVRFIGVIDNVIFNESVSNDTQVAAITIECINRFALRNILGGSVLSYTDQGARAAKINPAGAFDRFAERVPQLSDKTVVWPRFFT